MVGPGDPHPDPFDGGDTSSEAARPFGHPFAPDAVIVLDLNQAGTVEAILDNWSLPTEKVLPNTIGYVMDMGAQTAVLEPEYIDADYRDEHSTFWYSTFRQYPAVAARLHFFVESPAHFDRAAPEPSILESGEYLGYIVLRPVPTAPVGRTMIRWNPDDVTPRGAVVLCQAADRVNVFGSELDIEAAPFYAQDRRLTRCGHATMMSTAFYYYRYLRGNRVLPGAIAEAASKVLNDQGRAIPSPGVNLTQLLEAATAIGVPPRVYSLARPEEDPEALICRYLNSHFPVVIFARSHAFLLVGYQRVPAADGSHEIRFLRHDDESGPYEWVDLRVDPHGMWSSVIVPLPTKVHLSGVEAENVGKLFLESALEKSTEPEDIALLQRWRDPSRPLSLRSAVVTSNSLKATVKDRLLAAPVGASYQFAHMSRFVWVVELTDRSMRDAGEPCVLAEVVIDATDHPENIHPLAYRTPGAFIARDPRDSSEYPNPTLKSPDPARSVIDAIKVREHPV